MKRLRKIIILFLCAFLVVPIVRGQENTFRFLVISDVHISSDTARDEKLAGFIRDINNNVYGKTDFLIMTGDNVSSYFSDRDRPNDIENNRSLKLVSILKDLQIPYYICLGNHDYKIDRNKDSDAPFSKAEIDTMEYLWKNSAGLKPFYSFEHKEWNFIVLNSMRGRYLNRSFDDDQMIMLKNELSDGRPAFLFFHHPFQTDHFRIWAKPKDLITPEMETAFYDILQKYKRQIKAIFVGHGHMWNDDVLYNSITEYETASFGERPEQSCNIVEVNTSTGSYDVIRSVK